MIFLRGHAPLLGREGVEIGHLVGKEDLVAEMADIDQAERQAAMHRSELRVGEMIVEPQQRLARALARAQHADLERRGAIEGGDPVEKPRAVEHARAQMRAERLGHARELAGAHHQVARRDAAAVVQFQLDQVRRAVAHRRGGDRSHRQPIADQRIEMAGGPDDIVVPFDAAHTPAEMAELEQPAGFLEIAGEGEAAARIAWRGEVAEEMMVEVGAADQQAGLPCGAGAPLDEPEARDRGALGLGVAPVAIGGGEADAAGTEADTGEIDGGDRRLGDGFEDFGGF